MVSEESLSSPFETFEKQKQESKGYDLEPCETNPIALISDDDILESEPPEKIAPAFLPEGYKPRNRAVAVRDFPFPTTKSVQTPFCQDLVGLAVRDYPFPTKRVQTPLSQDLVQPVLSDASESEPTLESEYEAKESSKEVESELSGYRPEDSITSMNNNNLDLFGLWSGEEGFDMPEVFDSVGLVDPSETSDHESMEDTASSFISLIVPVNATDSTIFETKELSHKLSDAQDPLDAQSDSEEICPKSNSKNPENLPLRRSDRLLKKVPNTTEKPAPKSKEKASIEAAPSRRRSKRIRDSKSNPTRERDANKIKRIKH
ncbi:hypothetical protein V6N13_136613 [Hibiscus sabdariffa]|uniref:Uncharacterized protein n=1 Tax=Hibiscus sabdariffa TaxID=183260 RepID=A0ABR2DN37_9ROSI